MGTVCDWSLPVAWPVEALEDKIREREGEVNLLLWPKWNICARACDNRWKSRLVCPARRPVRLTISENVPLNEPG